MTAATFEWIDPIVERAVAVTRDGWPDDGFRHGEPVSVRLTTEHESYRGPRIYLGVDVEYRCPGRHEGCRAEGLGLCKGAAHTHWALWAYHPKEGLTLWQN